MRRASAHFGFTMVESLVCIIIVGVMLTAALRAVGASNSTQMEISDRAIGGMLAQSLMDEMLQQTFENPTSPSFGPESGENKRSLFNDVDDYNNWTETPPKNLDGTAMSNVSGWSRTVTVEWANLSNLNQNTTSDTGIKRITVTASKNGQLVATRVALRTRAP
jgi:prepilin-type N-terminal cleavage/methylation domain-containing protein